MASESSSVLANLGTWGASGSCDRYREYRVGSRGWAADGWYVNS